jgi:Terminase RNaseH-like domain
MHSPPASADVEASGCSWRQTASGNRKPALGLRLEPAVNAVEAGLTEVWNVLVSGRLKVQEHLHNWRSEFRKYHRDEKGRIVKANDHLMDATRYLVVSGRDRLQVRATPLAFGALEAPPSHWSAL